eukprot:6343096-Prymnesium_polylepis.1
MFCAGRNTGEGGAIAGGCGKGGGRGRAGWGSGVARTGCVRPPPPPVPHLCTRRVARVSRSRSVPATVKARARRRRANRGRCPPLICGRHAELLCMYGRACATWSLDACRSTIR